MCPTRLVSNCFFRLPCFRLNESASLSMFLWADVYFRCPPLPLQGSLVYLLFDDLLLLPPLPLVAGARRPRWLLFPFFLFVWPGVPLLLQSTQLSLTRMTIEAPSSAPPFPFSNLLLFRGSVLTHAYLLSFSSHSYSFDIYPSSVPPRLPSSMRAPFRTSPTFTHVPLSAGPPWYLQSFILVSHLLRSTPLALEYNPPLKILKSGIHVFLLNRRTDINPPLLRIQIHPVPDLPVATAFDFLASPSLSFCPIPVLEPLGFI